MLAVHAIDTLEIARSHGTGETKSAVGPPFWSSRPSVRIAASTAAVIAVILTSSLAVSGVAEHQSPRYQSVTHGDR
jgi:hypothetical protein